VAKDAEDARAADSRESRTGSRTGRRSRVPTVVGSIPLLGDLVKNADAQAQWLQELLEQNARLVAQLPATLKNFNDSIERFNQTVARLDRVVGRVEATATAARALVAPLEQVGPQLDRALALLDVPNLAEVPELVEAMRREALPALRAATDTQKQVAVLSATLDRVLSLLGELPGAALLRRLTAGPGDEGLT
jgi:ABC-type transporter Mla subunit MlaD